MYAVIETGGKQYRVAPGEVLNVELLNLNEGDSLTLKPLVFSREGEDIKIGTPTVEGASVTCKVLGHGKGKKIVIFKYKSKKNERKKMGHRQPFTTLEIISIEG